MQSPPSPLPIPDDGVKIALADVLTLPPDARCYMRYVFNPRMDGDKTGDTRSMKTSSLTLNYTSRASAGASKPVPLAGGLVLRVDLRLYDPRSGDWAKFWEEFAFDPAFARLVTKDQTEFAEKLVERTRRVSLGHYRRVDHPGGDFTYPAGCVRAGQHVGHLEAGTYEVEYPEEQFREERYTERVRLRQVKDVERESNSRAIDPAAFEALQHETHSLAPIVDHRYLKWRMLNTIKDGLAKQKSVVFRKVFGGLYYEFEGVRLVKDVPGKDKATDLDLFFEDLGIGNIKAGVTADVLFNQLRSDRRIIMLRSLVTGKPRDISVFSVPSAPPDNAGGAISGDIADQDVDIGDRSYANILNPRRKAREAIFPKSTRFHRFGLFNGDGARTDRVPEDVAGDTTIPDPHTKELQPAFSCIDCHNRRGRDGWQGAQNDGKEILKKSRVDIFDDLGRTSRRNDNIDRIAGFYKGNLKKFLSRARDDLFEATLEATGPWKESTLGQTDVCKLAADRLHAERDDWWWKTVDARRALWETGLEVQAEQAVALFDQLLPPDPAGLTELDGEKVFLEDPTVAALKAGRAVNRSDFAFARDHIAERLLKNPLWHKLRAKR